MLESIETRGIVLYNRDFREDDKLVKIFTEKSGKRMFFVKHAGKSRLNPMLQPLVTADMLLKINDDGLSYIDDFQDVQVYKKINADLFALSYATYVLALADEIQILSRFGVILNLHECCFCHRVGLPFDYSFRYSGVLCPDHYDRDERRAHWHPNVLYLLDQFQAVRFNELETISLQAEMKAALRQAIDQLYEEYVGIHLKAKKFIDSLSDWGAIMKDSSGGET